MVNLRNAYNSLKKLVENAGLNSTEPLWIKWCIQMPTTPKPPHQKV